MMSKSFLEYSRGATLRLGVRAYPGVTMTNYERITLLILQASTL